MNTQKEYAEHVVTSLGNALWADPSGVGQWKSPEALRIVETAFYTQREASWQKVRVLIADESALWVLTEELEHAIRFAAPQIPEDSLGQRMADEYNESEAAHVRPDAVGKVHSSAQPIQFIEEPGTTTADRITEEGTDHKSYGQPTGEGTE